MIQTFFEAMSGEDRETQLSVQEALGLMAPAFRQMDSANLKFIEAIVATYIEKDEYQVCAKFCGFKFFLSWSHETKEL